MTAYTIRMSLYYIQWWFSISIPLVKHLGYDVPMVVVSLPKMYVIPVPAVRVCKFSKSAEDK